MNRIMYVSLLLLLASPAGAMELPDVVKSCLARNLPETSSAQTIELRARDRGGYESIMQADVYWKRFDDAGTKVLMYMHEPSDVRGARFLIIQNEPQNDMYIYMPGLFKVRKITSKNISNSMLGTDFSYEDFERLQGVMTEMKAEQQADEVLDGRPVYVINSYPGDNSGYEKIVSYIDTGTCVTLKTEMFENAGQLRKRLIIKPENIRQTGGVHVPMEVVITDLRDKTRTTMVIDEISIGPPLEDDLFDPANLKDKKAPPIVSE
ncbi:MAG: outer membrane lipoprotein-sorting protein [Gammaproteobacteria bacterium]